MDTARNLTLCVSNPDLHAAIPFSVYSPGISEDAMWLLDGEIPFGFRVRCITDAYPFIDDFRPHQSMLYFYSKRDIIKKTKPRLRTVNIHVATNDDVMEALRRRNVPAIEENLDYGDVAFTTSDGRLFQLVIERKAKGDFVSSITDGRLEIQSALMAVNVPDHAKILYFIEGDPRTTQHGPNDKSKLANIVYPLMRKGISTVIGEDIDATARFVENIHYLLETAPEDKFEDHALSRALNSGVKKADLIGQHKFLQILLLVPGVGKKMAPVVVAKFETYSRMRDAYIEGGEFALEKIEVVSETDGKKKQVGKAASRKIYDFFEFDSIVSSGKKRTPVSLVHGNNNNNKKKAKIEEEEDEEEDE